MNTPMQKAIRGVYWTSVAWKQFSARRRHKRDGGGGAKAASRAISGSGGHWRTLRLAGRWTEATPSPAADGHGNNRAAVCARSPGRRTADRSRVVMAMCGCWTRQGMKVCPVTTKSRRRKNRAAPQLCRVAAAKALVFKGGAGIKPTAPGKPALRVKGQPNHKGSGRNCQKRHI